MRDNAKATGALIEQREANAKPLVAVDDPPADEAIADAHADGIKQLTAAFEPSYATLSDAQKKNGDGVFIRRARPLRPKKTG
jgi:periplasmic protein CpxP/Spy